MTVPEGYQLERISPESLYALAQLDYQNLLPIVRAYEGKGPNTPDAGVSAG